MEYEFPSGLVGAVATLRDDSDMFRVLTDAMPQMVWSTLPDGFHDYYNARWYEFTGVPEGSTDGEAWNGMFHPDDQDMAWERWRHSLATGEPYEIEYRLRHASGDYRWTLGRALPVRDKAGVIVRWIGTCTDIDDTKRISEQTELMSRELSHRIKNIFAVVGGLIALSAHDNAEVQQFANELVARITALGKAHDFVRPHSAKSAPYVGEAMLHDMIRDLMSPYPALSGGRITITGEDVPIDDAGATPIALAFHELATNASKYGALSVVAGEVRIETQIDGEQLKMAWTELGGPEISEVPTHLGFGSTLAELSIGAQLGGIIARNWNRSGLSVQMAVPTRRLRRFTPEQISPEQTPEAQQAALLHPPA